MDLCDPLLAYPLLIFLFGILWLLPLGVSSPGMAQGAFQHPGGGAAGVKVVHATSGCLQPFPSRGTLGVEVLAWALQRAVCGPCPQGQGMVPLQQAVTGPPQHPFPACVCLSGALLGGAEDIL